MGKIVGNLWNDTDIEIVEINNEFYTLNKWNGEVYGNCWKVKDKKGIETLEEKTEYEIKPIYNQIDENEFEIVDYALI